jgi:hypothetical protein
MPPISRAALVASRQAGRAVVRREAALEAPRLRVGVAGMGVRPVRLGPAVLVVAEPVRTGTIVRRRRASA